MEFHITIDNQGMRLDVFLAQSLPEFSRSQLQKLIKDESILVNQKKAKPHQDLMLGDHVTILNTAMAAKDRPTDSPLFNKIEVIDEQPDYLVINKPAGLIIHEAPSMQEAAITDWLLANYSETKGVGEDALRPGIVHRLDKDVSGLVIIARNQDAYKYFKKLFQGRRLKKIYTALVHGDVKKDVGVIDFPIERSVMGYKMAARPKNQEGKPAESHFTVLKRYLHYTLLEVLIKTGRTHQIRAHMAAYGNPIVGDNLYGTHAAKLNNRKLNTERIYLFASKLEFKDPGGQKRSYALQLPASFTKLMDTLK